MSQKFGPGWFVVALVVGAAAGVVLLDLGLRLDPEGAALGAWLLIIANGALAVAAFVGIGQTSRLERKHERARRRAVDARVGVLALGLQRDLRRWVEDAPDTVTGIVQLYDDLKAAGVGEALVAPDPMKLGGAGWASDRLVAGVDPRIQQLVEDSPDVSDDVSQAITEMCARWVKMNQLFTKLRRDSGEGVAAIDPRDVAIAYGELNRCVKLLDRVIPPDLRAARDVADV